MYHQKWGTLFAQRSFKIPISSCHKCREATREAPSPTMSKAVRGMAHGPLSTCGECEFDNLGTTISILKCPSTGLCSPKGPMWFRSENQQLSARAIQWRELVPPNKAPLGQSTLSKNLRQYLWDHYITQAKQPNSTLCQAPCEAMGVLRIRTSSSQSSLTVKKGQHVVKVTIKWIHCNESQKRI